MENLFLMSFCYIKGTNHWQCQVVNLKKKLTRFIQGNRESQTRLFKEIHKELEVFLSKENNDINSIDSIFDFFIQISDSVQEELDERLSGDNNTKRSAKALSKKLALMLNTRVDSVKKIKRIIKIAIETTLKYGKNQGNSDTFTCGGKEWLSTKNNKTIQNKRNTTRTKNCRY